MSVMHPLLVGIHIGMGTAAIMSGAAALAFRKGSRPHRMAGNVFFVSMLIMVSLGTYGATLIPERLSWLNGIMTLYMLSTSWVTIRRGEGQSGVFEVGAFLVIVAVAAAQIFFGIVAASGETGAIDGFPAAAYFIFGSVAVLAAMLDLRIIRRGGVSGIQRIARHLWRMCFALFIATASLFLGQQQVFPEALQGTITLALPVLLVLGLMVFWIIRVRFSKAWREA